MHQLSGNTLEELVAQFGVNSNTVRKSSSRAAAIGRGGTIEAKLDELKTFSGERIDAHADGSKLTNWTIWTF